MRRLGVDKIIGQTVFGLATSLEERQFYIPNQDLEFLIPARLLCGFSSERQKTKGDNPKQPMLSDRLVTGIW